MKDHNILKIVDMTDEKTSSDGRKYRTVYFQPQAPNGLLSNARARGRNIWNQGPNGSQGDALYDQLTDKQGNPKIGAKVIGDVQTVEVEEYYIPNEYGKFTDPETGQPANKANTYSSVVFEDETITQLASQQGHTIAGEQEAEELENQTIDEEVAV